MDRVHETITASIVSSSMGLAPIQTNEPIAGKDHIDDGLGTNRSNTARTQEELASRKLPPGLQQHCINQGNQSEQSREINESANGRNSVVTPATDNNTVDGITKVVPWKDVRKIDVVCRDKKHRHGSQQAKIDFHHGFVWFRKLIDKVRPAFMECDIHGKSTIGRWVTERVLKRGGKFLEDNETTGECREMAVWDVLEYTISILGDDRPWTTVVHSSCRDEIAPDQSWETLLNEFVHDCGLKPNILEKILVNSHILSEPSRKKPRVHLSPVVPPEEISSQSMLPARFDRVALERALEEQQRSKEPPLYLRNYWRQKRALEEELVENGEILVMRQERLGRLQREYRLLQERQMYLPSEKWLTERIVRQEEIFENQELMEIQKQRCLRLRAHLELNERKMLENQALLENQKRLLLDRSLSSDDVLRSILGGVRQGKTEEDLMSQRPLEEQKMPSSMASELAKNRELRRMLVQQGVLNQQRSLEIELNRNQEIASNRNKEELIAADQERKDRIAMEETLKRRAAMQQAMEEFRQRMINNQQVSYAAPEQPTGTVLGTEIEKKIDANEALKTQNPDAHTNERPQPKNPVIAKSIGNKEDGNPGKEQDKRAGNNVVVLADDEDEAEDVNDTDDDDSIVI
mmetsp:Transcript_15/g.39  ORF Transcript_15/g.39 Transcript_15/m.39 type:complete len:634 (+) Transcript_15:221-2122(+)